MAEEKTVIDFDDIPERDSPELDKLSIDELEAFDRGVVYVLEATAHSTGSWFLSRERCREFNGTERCGGKVELNRYDLPAQIKWRCKQCKTDGKIINFTGTPWDIRNLPENEQQRRINLLINSDISKEFLDQFSEETVQQFMDSVSQAVENISLGIMNRSKNLKVLKLNRLIDSDWESDDSVVVLNDALPLKQLESSIFFFNARTLLLYFKEQGSKLACTSSGNMKRNDVAELMDRGQWPEGYIDEIQRFNKVINEEDVWLLHVLRKLLEISGLIHKRNGAFHLTKERQSLLEETNAGILYRRLFYTYFKKMNIGYLVNEGELPDLQGTIAYTLHKLQSKDEGWKLIRGSIDDVLLSEVRNELETKGGMASRVYQTVFKPLTYFGLLEVRKSEEAARDMFGQPDEFKKTPLMDEFLTFDMDKAQSADNVELPLNKAPEENGYGNPTPIKNKDQKIYQLKVRLDDITPPIWRRILVPANVKLPDLHKIIQSSFGWENVHLHQFIKGREFYGPPSKDRFGIGRFTDYRRIRLYEILRSKKQSFVYEYDFGDGWRHTILLEKILPVNQETDYPVCIKGKRNGPPEDCGGPWGYQHMLQALRDSGHPDHQTQRDWLGKQFDPEHFNKEQINKRLLN